MRYICQESENCEKFIPVPGKERQYNLQIKDTVLEQLDRRSGGYQNLQGPNVIMLNYRSLSRVDDIATKISLRDVLSESFNRDLIDDRIVFVGDIKRDTHLTPYSRMYQKDAHGVFIQAHSTSQILSAVLDGRPLIWGWPEWKEYIWIIAWANLGIFLLFKVEGISFIFTGVFVFEIGVFWICSYILTLGGWIPFFPTALTLGLLGGSATMIRHYSQEAILRSLDMFDKTEF